MNFHLQGVDPDAPEEDEENEADDIDADQGDPDLI
jgi:anaphase-promoting complex subunit 7